RIGAETGDPLTREAEPGFTIDNRLQLEIDRGLVDPGAMPIEVGCNAFERARAVEYGRAEPGRMGASTHDRHIAFMPGAFEKCPGLGKTDGGCCLGHPSSRLLRVRGVAG